MTSFLQNKDESPDNRFRGHTGITKISVQQKSYFTFETTIDWHCPDPVYFEKEFEPFFLKMGTYCAIEFGWGINDKGINVPDLNVESMEDLLKGVEKRNLETAGNYFCNIGIVTKFDWRIGTEHEKFGFKKKDLSQINFNDIQNIILNFSSRFNWIKIKENGNIIGLKKNKSSITLEPGGQIELSGAPLKSLFETLNSLGVILCTDTTSPFSSKNKVLEPISGFSLK